MTTENKFFNYEEWDDMGDFMINFQGITLKRDIGNLKSGESYQWANLDFQNGILEIGNEEILESIKWSIRLDGD